MKYILVTGGVISGIGKGVIASSIGVILKSSGVRVTSIKIDPYINIDAGTFSPYEHGEVYVLHDGGEVDLDLGNYERFLDVTLHKDNNITTGKIYQSVIEKERRGDYLGKTVQVVPHITNAIQEWVESVARRPVDDSGLEPQCCIIELGGTIGDIEGMQFIEAFRQFQFRVGRDNFACVHVNLILQPKTTGEHKTKPTQNSVKELRALGLSPDLIMCRSEKPIGDDVKEKVSMFCQVPPAQVISVPDCTSVYQVPLKLNEEKVCDYLMGRLNLDAPVNKSKKFLSKWKDLAERHDRLLKEVTIALVGKYTKLEDAYASVTKALQHSAMACNHKLNLKYIEATDLEEDIKEQDAVRYYEAWSQLCSSNGVLIPGGFGDRGLEGMIKAAHWARTNNKPMLGVCLGMQCAVIEFARHELKLDKAHSSEGDKSTPHPVVVEMPEHHPGQLGGTMRLGERTSIFNTEDSVLRKLYNRNDDQVQERHRHRYEVNPLYVSQIEAKGMCFVARDETGERMEIMELKGHPYYVGVQYHPEYLSRPLRPSPPYLGLILAATGKLQSFLQCPTDSDSDASEDEDLRPEALQMKCSISRNASTASVCSSACSRSASAGFLTRPVNEKNQDT